MAAKKYPSSKQFRKELDSGRLQRIYLFLGEEEGEKDKLINRIIDMVFTDPADRANSIGRFHAETDEFMEAAAFAMSSSMFADDMLCIIRNIDAVKKNDETAAVFRDMILNIPDSNRLIMTSAAVKIPDIITKDLLEKMYPVQFWKFFDSDIYTYISVSLKKLSFDFDNRSVELIMELTGKEIKKVDNAIEMLHFSGQDRHLTEEKIRNIIYDDKNVTVFEFIDSLFKREKKVFRLLKKVIEEGNPELLMLNLITRHVEMIESYHDILLSGKTPEEAMKSSGVLSRNHETFRRQAAIFTGKKVRKIFPLIARADYELKSSGHQKDLISNPLLTLVKGIIFSI